jgi:hypothetical protein
MEATTVKILTVLLMFAAVGCWCAGDGIVGTCLAFMSIHTWVFSEDEQPDDTAQPDIEITVNGQEEKQP